MSFFFAVLFVNYKILKLYAFSFFSFFHPILGLHQESFDSDSDSSTSSESDMEYTNEDERYNNV